MRLPFFTVEDHSIPKYRLICLDPETGLTQQVLHYQAESDTMAVHLAEIDRRSRPAELWRAYRALRRWR